MSDSLLRSRLIRLAHSQPALRPALLPLLKTASPVELREVAAGLRSKGLTVIEGVRNGTRFLVVLEGARKASAALQKMFPVVSKGSERDMLVFEAAQPVRPDDGYMSIDEETGEAWKSEPGVTLFKSKVFYSVQGARPGTYKAQEVPVYVVVGYKTTSRGTQFSSLPDPGLPDSYLSTYLNPEAIRGRTA